MLSRLTSLSLSSLKILDAEEGNVVIQTDPLYTAKLYSARLKTSYRQHY
jgi:hypothetical protein